MSATFEMARLRAAMRGAVDRGDVPGLVVLAARRGEVHVEVAGEAVGRDTLFRIASMTKPVTAVAALLLVEEGRLKLDEPIDLWLPELGGRRVLRALDAQPDDTVPAVRAITLRDLLSFRMGFGALLDPPGRYPIQRAIAEAGLWAGFTAIPYSPDEWLRRLATLPLLHQPGERWSYHTASDVLGILIARVTGQPFPDFLAERVFGPLGMHDSGFHVPAGKRDRLATCYFKGPRAELQVFDAADNPAWAEPPVFPSGAAGLVSSVDDYHAFARMLLQGGAPILTRSTVALMTTDQLTPDQKAASRFYPGFFEANGWGLGLAVTTQRTSPADTPGRYGWDGGFGTSWRNDPSEGLTVIVMTQRVVKWPDDIQMNDDYYTLVHQALAGREEEVRHG